MPAPSWAGAVALRLSRSGGAALPAFRAPAALLRARLLCKASGVAVLMRRILRTRCRRCSLPPLVSFLPAPSPSSLSPRSSRFPLSSRSPPPPLAPSHPLPPVRCPRTSVALRSIRTMRTCRDNHRVNTIASTIASAIARAHIDRVPCGVARPMAPGEWRACSCVPSSHCPQARHKHRLRASLHGPVSPGLWLCACKQRLRHPPHVLRPSPFKPNLSVPSLLLTLPSAPFSPFPTFSLPHPPPLCPALSPPHQLRALLPLPPRHAISIDYGRLSTDLFLLDYGFVPATNAHDTLPMAYGLPLIEAARAAAGLDGLEGRDGGEEQGGKGGGEAWETRTGTGEGKANAEKETGREERGEDTSGRRLEGPLDPDAGGGARARMEVISKLGLSGPNADRKMTLGGPGYIDPRLLAALRVLYAPALVDVRQLPLQELQGLDAVGRLGRECEQKTVRTLLGLCFIFLQSFSQVPPAEGSAAAAAAGKAAKDTAAATAGAGAGASKTPGSAAADSSAAAAVRLAAEAAGMESGAAERAIGGMTVQEARLVEAFRAEKRGLVLRVMSFLQGRLDV
ncbi:unnamed protein product [Closterium sp. NIES-53]